MNKKIKNPYPEISKKIYSKIDLTLREKKLHNMNLLKKWECQNKEFLMYY